MAMLAYFSDAKLKAKYVRRAQQHREADQIVQSYGYWIKDDSGEFKGCAIGCLSHSEDGAYVSLERQTGIPEILSRLADAIFEGLPDPDYKTWPERFAAAPRAGVDLSRVHHRFFAWMTTEGVAFDRNANPVVAEACRNVADLHSRAATGDDPSSAEWSAAARSAAWSARSAAWSARSAARSARSAAWSAAESAAYVRMADKLESLMSEVKPDGEPS